MAEESEEPGGEEQGGVTVRRGTRSRPEHWGRGEPQPHVIIVALCRGGRRQKWSNLQTHSSPACRTRAPRLRGRKGWGMGGEGGRKKGVRASTYSARGQGQAQAVAMKGCRVQPGPLIRPQPMQLVGRTGVSRGWPSTCPLPTYHVGRRSKETQKQETQRCRGQ